MSKIKGKYIENGTIDETKLNSSINTSLDLADSAIQSTDLTAYVPYSGASSNLNLGTQTLTAGIINTNNAGGQVANFNNTNGGTDITMRYGYAGYGWYWLYEGSGAGNDNKHQLWSEGAGGTDKMAYEITQDGKMTFPYDATFSSNIIVDGTVDGVDIAAEEARLANTSGTNTGDQTSIVGITGTKSQFDTSCSDGNFLYIGDITPGDLWSDAVDSNIIPDTDESYNLGSLSKYFSTIYAKEINVKENNNFIVGLSAAGLAEIGAFKFQDSSSNDIISINEVGGIPNTTNIDFYEILDMNSNKITNVTDPTSNQDAATKKYVDDNTGGEFTYSDKSSNFSVAASNVYNITGSNIDVDATTSLTNGDRFKIIANSTTQIKNSSGYDVYYAGGVLTAHNLNYIQPLQDNSYIEFMKTSSGLQIITMSGEWTFNQGVDGPI